MMMKVRQVRRQTGRVLLMMGGRDTPDRAYAVDEGWQVTRQTGRVLLMRIEATRPEDEVLMVEI